jgi:hypothetical protein
VHPLVKRLAGAQAVVLAQLLHRPLARVHKAALRQPAERQDGRQTPTTTRNHHFWFKKNILSLRRGIKSCRPIRTMKILSRICHSRSFLLEQARDPIAFEKPQAKNNEHFGAHKIKLRKSLLPSFHHD